MSRYIDVEKFVVEMRERVCKDCEDEMACWACGLHKAIGAIDDYPPADVASVVHGHWSKEMRFTEDFMGNRTYGYKCSVCGNLANRLQFCGNCGAKMDESEESKNV